MKHDVKAPSVGESITEVSILKWNKKSGDYVKVGETILEIESDKATVEVVAEFAGTLTSSKEEGDRIPVGSVIGSIDDTGKASAIGASASSAPKTTTPASNTPLKEVSSDTPLMPSVRKMVSENGIDPNSISGSGKRGQILKGDVVAHLEGGGTPKNAGLSPASSFVNTDRPGTRRVKMSMLRSKIAERLKAAQNTAAILTTFNECDLTNVMKVRASYKDKFKEKYGVSLGFMSFFTRASVIALKAIPEVNASMEGNEILYHDFADVGIAVGTERGLVVPVLRNCEKKGFIQIEKDIADFAVKAKNNKLSIADLTGGTFTISNGGTYGSLMSTPILNPPQSAILGMHKTMDRPVVINGKIEIRPMMYLALSYDHRIIDGKGAVTFLVMVKDLIENPEKLEMEFINELK